MSAYSDALETGSTTLCRCFRITRADETVMGFTDHDADISFDGVTYSAEAALSASEAASTLGFAPDEMEAHGALSHQAITEADLIAGRFDGAAVEVWDVDWRNTATRALLGRYTVGEVERGGVAFRAELRSLAASLDRPEGRVHTTLCDVRRLGDGRCGLDLTAWQATATVVSVDGLEVWVSGLDEFNPGFFDKGTVEWLTGGNAGSAGDIRATLDSAGSLVLSLWRAPAATIAIGDTLTVTAGCNRTADTCRNRFNNLVNFRGFPHMPGEAFLRDYGIEGDPDQTGGSRFE
ncbi:DUF2163 domain-containing protein [Epibacterium sp. SM1979]|uniref:DUF2163 domain-containing protein n=1 Tax=Tritonibacter litoralis TaxID=2662264 RepID=A0A843YIM4_9RHOB|nr:DUF2163 domain-containing protein [Tritonibacter litoralis]MQQ09112.1 DUF2163 domain-containing protein [Tritonibacter litoralis]